MKFVLLIVLLILFGHAIEIPSPSQIRAIQKERAVAREELARQQREDAEYAMTTKLKTYCFLHEEKVKERLTSLIKEITETENTHLTTHVDIDIAMCVMQPMIQSSYGIGYHINERNMTIDFSETTVDKVGRETRNHYIELSVYYETYRSIVYYRVQYQESMYDFIKYYFDYLDGATITEKTIKYAISTRISNSTEGIPRYDLLF